MQYSYTDAPQLHSNLILGSLQLLGWIIFHPSAWRNYVKQIDPDLSPNFCLLQLERKLWRSPVLRQILIKGYLVPWILISLLLFSFSGLLGLENFWTGTWFGIGVGIIAGLYIGTILGVGVGLIGLLLGSILFSGISGLSIYLAADNIPNQTIITIIIALYSVAFTLFGGMVGTTISHLDTKKIRFRGSQNLKPSKKRSQSWRFLQILEDLFFGSSHALEKEIGSTIVGVLFSFIAYITGVTITTIVEGKSAFNIVWGGLPHLTSSNMLNYLLISGTFSIIVFIGLSTSGGLQTGKWRYSFYLGLSGGFLGGLTLFLISGNEETSIAFLPGLAGGSWLVSVYLLTYSMANYFTGSQSGAIAGTLGVGGSHTMLLLFAEGVFHWTILPVILISTVVSLTSTYWLPILLSPLFEIWNLIIYRRDERRYDGRHPHLLSRNSTFWNELQRTTPPTLQDHLNLIVRRTPEQSQAAIDYLATTPHHKVAQEAQIELDAHRLEQCNTVEEIRQVYIYLTVTELNGPVSNLLRDFTDFSKAIDAAFEQTTLLHRRRTLGEIKEQLAGWQQGLKRSDESYATRFLPIAASWQKVVAEYVTQLQREVELRQEVDNPYIHSLPLTEEQGIFFGRREIVHKIEQLVLDSRRPPLLLYGQRRMGKTSLLQNLGRLLHSKMSIVPMFVDGQEIKLASSYGEFLDLLAYEMRKSAQETRRLTLPDSGDLALSHNPFIRFMHWLDQVEITLKQQGFTIGLLMLDEFEEIKRAADKGRFDQEDIPSLLRHLIQHRPHFKLLLAGSHTLQEFEHWASYLINVQVLKLDYLKEGEACDLIEKPLPNFPLRYESGATQHILTLTRCHPHLVQLLCYEIVELKNSQPEEYRRLVTVDDIEEAVQKAIEGGDFFFANIRENQIDQDGLQLLTFLANHESNEAMSQSSLQQCLFDPDQLDQTLALLKRRDLIEATKGGYRFQVEMTRRWFAQQEVTAQYSITPNGPHQ